MIQSWRRRMTPRTVARHRIGGVDQKPGERDLPEVAREDVGEAREGQERWLDRPCDACGDHYRIWGTQVDLLPYCGGVKCKRDH